ncbi:MAG TPA: DoxX family protein [Polyangiaceae bacterium]
MTESRPTIAARLALGLVFAVFGLNGFLHFLPMPPPQGAAADFMGALAATGYMFPVIKGVEVVAAVLLLSGRLPALALLLLAPIVVNIIAFHAFLAPAGLALGLVVLALGVFLARQYWPAFRGVFQSPERHTPASAVASAEA